jgi:hypothetical protein
MLIVLNVTRVRKFEVITDKFNVVRLCTSGVLAQSELLSYIIITLQSLLELSNIMQYLNETCFNFVPELRVCLIAG